MAFKDLAIAEMVALFSPWVNDKAEKAAFVAIPETAGLYKQVERAYAGVVAAKPTPVVDSPELAAAREAADAADDAHDNLARGVACGLDSQRYLALGLTPPDVERAKACEEASAKLFPQGMGFISSSYRAESGNTERVAIVLEGDAALGAFLKTIPTKKGGTLLEVATLWLEAGATLGKLEDTKAALSR